jgi:hypothetical protein
MNNKWPRKVSFCRYNNPVISNNTTDATRGAEAAYASGLLTPEGNYRPVVSVSTLDMLYYWNLQFLNSVIIN